MKEVKVYYDRYDGPTIVTVDDKLITILHSNDGRWYDNWDCVYEALGSRVIYANYGFMPDNIVRELLSRGWVISYDGDSR